MTDKIQYEGRSDAAVVGATEAIATTSTGVLTADEVDGCIYWWVYNNSDTTIWVRHHATGAAVGAGKPLAPGGYLEEWFYKGAVCAAHGGSGSKNLVVGAV